jgi:hypothetical protein
MFKFFRRRLSTPPKRNNSPKSPKRNNSPKPAPNLPPEMLREIAKALSPRNARVLRSVTNKYTRKTLPIGLAVTRVGRSKINIQRPPVINCSMATAKTPRVRYSNENIDRVIPAAYKNPQWKYYLYLTQNKIAFKNTPNGQPYTVNNKTGARKRNSRLNETILNSGWKPRTNRHTLQAYYKRAEKSTKYEKGHWKRLNKKQAINGNVALYRNGNRAALNKWTLSNLAWWASSSHIGF